MKIRTVLPLFLLAALGLAAQDVPEGPAAAAREIRISAKKYEYTPSEIRVRQGERIRLVLTATDRKHGFEIKELGIKTELEKDKDTVVEFTAEKPGEFEFHCTVFCGFGHRRMKGKLIVEPAPPTP